MSFAWKMTAQEKIPARPQLRMISDVGGVESVRQLKSDPAAVAASDMRRNRLPTSGQRLTTPSER